MTGSLRERNGKYHVVLNFKDKGGKWKQKCISTGLEVRGNKKKAQKFLNDLLSKYGDTDFQKYKQILFTEYIKNRLDNWANHIDQITLEGYQSYVYKHILPYFEPLKLDLSQVKPKHILDYYNFKATRGRLDGKPGGISPSSLRKHSFIINKVLNQAYIEEFINRNPAANVPLPKMEKREKVGKFLEVGEAKKMLELFDGHILKPLILVTLYYGLRRSEVLGLKWDAINFKDETLAIKHTVVKNITTVAKDKTKNFSSKRRYKLLPEIKEILIDLKNAQKTNKRNFGSEYTESDYVFTWPDGRPISPDYVSHGFKKVIKKNNFPYMRFHDLRHSCASILYDKGWKEKDIQEWLGHSDIGTTMEIYTHISNSRKNILAKDLEGTFLSKVI